MLKVCKIVDYEKSHFAIERKIKKKNMKIAQQLW